MTTHPELTRHTKNYQRTTVGMDNVWHLFICFWLPKASLQNRKEKPVAPSESPSSENWACKQVFPTALIASTTWFYKFWSIQLNAKQNSLMQESFKVPFLHCRFNKHLPSEWTTKNMSKCCYFKSNHCDVAPLPPPLSPWVLESSQEESAPDYIWQPTFVPWWN